MLSRIEKLSDNRNRLYLLLAAILASLGYASLLLLPLSAFVSIYLLPGVVQGVGSPQDWAWVGLLVSLAGVCTYLCLCIYRLKFPPVRGLPLTREMAPGLFDSIKEVRAHFGRPTIEHVVITDQFEIRIESIPKSGVPFRFSNTLVIGLPLLQSLTPDELRCELSRCIGQHSGIIPRMTFFITRSCLLWNQYSDALKNSGNRLLRVLMFYMASYSRLVALVSIPAQRLEEFVADSCAMDYTNEGEVLNTLISASIARMYLESRYWPSVRNMVTRNHGEKIMPFAGVEKVMRKFAAREIRKKWLGYAYHAERRTGDTMPVLKERMEGIGHTKVRSIPIHTVSAADEYFGVFKNRIISIVDKQWCSTTLHQWVKEHKTRCRDLGIFKGLSRKSQQQFLWPREIGQYARLARTYKGSPAGESVRKLLKRNIRNLLPAFLVNKSHDQSEAGDLSRQV